MTEFKRLEAACGGVINPETLAQFQIAMREYEYFIQGLGELLAPKKRPKHPAEIEREMLYGKKEE